MVRIEFIAMINSQVSHNGWKPIPPECLDGMNAVALSRFYYGFLLPLIESTRKGEK
jgi:hypothetical protein